MISAARTRSRPVIGAPRVCGCIDCAVPGLRRCFRKIWPPGEGQHDTQHQHDPGRKQRRLHLMCHQQYRRRIQCGQPRHGTHTLSRSRPNGSLRKVGSSRRTPWRSAPTPPPAARRDKPLQRLVVDRRRHDRHDYGTSITDPATTGNVTYTGSVRTLALSSAAWMSDSSMPVAVPAT